MDDDVDEDVEEGDFEHDELQPGRQEREQAALPHVVVHVEPESQRRQVHQQNEERSQEAEVGNLVRSMAAAC